MPTPNPAKVARDVAGAMVAREPIEPLGWATARREDGTPIYLVAVVMGSENCQQFDLALEKLRPFMKPVDIFQDTPGEPVEAGS